MINTKQNHQLTIIVDGINLTPAIIELDRKEYSVPFYYLSELARYIERIGLGTIITPRPYGSQFPSHVYIPVPSKKLDGVRKILEKYGEEK